jgi:uncharacterized protein (TIGR01370 family)
VIRRPTVLTAAFVVAALALADVGAHAGNAHASAAAGVATAAQATTPATAAAEIRQARTFAFALGADLTSKNIARLAKRDLVIVDGEATAAQVKKLKAKGAIVLGYLSVGTVESWRPWFKLLKDYRLEKLADWDGERYTDVSVAAARDVLADTVTPQLLAKGFDGLFLDNVDMVSDHTAQQPGMLDLVGRIAAKVHSAGGALMAQNGDDIIEPFLVDLDGWNREDPTGTYDFEKKKYVPTDTAGRRSARDTIRLVKAAGLLVTTTDYFGSPTSAQAKRAIRISCQAGAVPFVGDIDLERVTATAPHC